MKHVRMMSRGRAPATPPKSGPKNNPGQARIAYQNVLADWKDAYPDVPLLIAARSEYAKLH